MADPGVCSAAVDERALDMSAETRQSFVATVGAEDPLTVDAQFVADLTAALSSSTRRRPTARSKSTNWPVPEHHQSRGFAQGTANSP